MPRVIRYEIAAANPAWLGQFYGSLLGWQFNQAGDQEYWEIYSGEEHGIDGAMIPRPEGFPGVINTIDVPSVDDCCNRIEGLGGAVVLPKTTLPGIGYLAYCQDPEGNVFGIMEIDGSAG